MRKISAFFIVLFATSLCYAEPSVHEIYQAAETGNFTRADAMMGEVLRAHPESAKAHFVNAELLTKEGKLAGAHEELAKAKSLDPELKFASPVAVSELTAKLSPVAQHPTGTQSGSSSLTIFAIVICGLALIAFFMMRRRNTVQVFPASGMPMGSSYPNGPSPMGPMGSMGGVGYPPSAGMGGSGLMGSLATGAALGAGMVAGEVLAHRLMDGNGREIQPGMGNNNFQSDSNSGNYDMGGQNFGVSGNDWGDSGGGFDDDSSGSW